MPANAREKLVEAAAEGDEELLEKFLEDGDLSPTTKFNRGIRVRTLSSEIVPVFCGSAFKNKGVQAVLDAIIYFMPSPIDVPAFAESWTTRAKVFAGRMMRTPSRRWLSRSRRTRLWVT